MSTVETDEIYLRHSPDAVVIVDEHGIIELTNPRADEMFGHQPGELSGEPIEILVPDQFAKIHSAHRTRYRAAPATRAMGDLGVDLRGRRADGSSFPVEISLSPLVTDDGPRVMACVRDITDRRLHEQQADRVRDALDSVSEAAFMFDPESLCFTYVNQGAVDQVGYSRDELLGGMTPLHIKPDFTRESFSALVNRLTSGEHDALTFTTSHRHKDGTDLVVEVALQHHETGDAQGGVMVALARDITERLAIERRARADREALGVAEDRERIARDLHDVVIQRLFAAGMRLQAGLTDPDLLAVRSDETVSELDETIGVIRRTIFALTENGSTTATKRIHELTDAHTDRTGVVVDLEISGDIEAIDEVVMTELEASLTEALSNVARHAAARTVMVSIEGGDEVVLRVADDGVGIPHTRPAGFGLPNLSARAEELGGKFTVASSAAEGTHLEWRVPVGGAGDPGT